MREVSRFGLVILAILICFVLPGHAQNNALDLDGIDDIVTAPNHPDLVPVYGDLTIETWVSADAPASGGSTIVRKTSSGCDYYAIMMNSSGMPISTIRDGNCNARFYFGPGGTFTGNGDWHHLAMVIDRGKDTLFLYLNGVLVSAGVINRFDITADGDLLFGTNWISNHGYFDQLNGSLDEVRVWNYARSHAEILSTKDCELIGNENGLVAYYNFNHGVAGGNNTGVTTLTDLGPHGLDGTLSGLALNGSTSNWVSGPANVSGTCGISPVPTLSQWGLIVFALLLLNFGAVAIWKTAYRPALRT